MRLRWPGNEQFLFFANVLVDKLLYRKTQLNHVKEILVIKWDEIGDMAVSAHVFESLKKSFPDAKIHLICKPFVKSLVEYDPNIDFIATTLDAYNAKFDIVVELRGTWKTLLKTFKYWPVNRVSRATVRWKNKGNQQHEIVTNQMVLQPLLGQMDKTVRPRLYFSHVDVKKVEDFLSVNEIQKFAIVHAGARKKLRQWPLDRFALAIQFLKRKYNLDIVFAGTEEDEADINVIAEKVDFKTYKFTRGFSLSQFSALCSKASFYLGNESGPLQIAATFEIPLVGLFGPGVKDVFYPLSTNARVLHYILDCNPCDQVHCVRPEQPCIQLIQVNEVEQAIDSLLKN
jgi:ADP-heptose:LPS heptosyltransferase